MAESHSSKTEVSGQHRAVLNRHLRPGETVLYAARPTPWRTYFDGGLGQLVIIVFTLGAVLFGSVGAVMSIVFIVIKGIEAIPAISLLGFGLFAFVGGALQFELLSMAHSSVHAVTDHRLLTVRAWQPKSVCSTEISSILCLRAVHGAWRGRGTLTFGTQYTAHTDDDGSPYWYMQTESWCGVPNAAGAHELIKLRWRTCASQDIPPMPLWAIWGKRMTTPPPT